jgi:hypothetical protein
MAKIVSITLRGNGKTCSSWRSVLTTETSELRLQNHKPHPTE